MSDIEQSVLNGGICASAEPLIRVEHLSKEFGDLLVLDDISAEIGEGERIVVVGPSGGGKSTFLRCLNLSLIHI